MPKVKVINFDRNRSTQFKSQQYKVHTDTGTASAESHFSLLQSIKTNYSFLWPFAKRMQMRFWCMYPKLHCLWIGFVQQLIGSVTMASKCYNLRYKPKMFTNSIKITVCPPTPIPYEIRADFVSEMLSAIIQSHVGFKLFVSGHLYTPERSWPVSKCKKF